MVGSDIQQLPREMMQLINLRLLDLNYCKKLKVIPRDILSSLFRLECLFMKSSFSEWAVDEVCDGDSNACLSELNNLHSLRTIEVKIPNTELVPKADMFDHNLTSYAIFIGSFDRLPKTYEESRTLHLKGGDESLLSRYGIRKLLRTTEDLLLWGLEVCGRPIPVRSLYNLKTLVVRECHGLKILFLLFMGRVLPQLEEMTIEYCNEMQQIMEDGHVGINLQLLFPKLRSLKLGFLPKLVNFVYFSSEMETTSEAMFSQGNPDINMPFFNCQVLFSNLEILQLYNLPKIKEIWHHQLPLDSFSNLRILRVKFCEHLLNLIPRHLIQSFKNLKEIEVGWCENLRHVFDVQGYDDTDQVQDGVYFLGEVLFSNLEILQLYNLPKIKEIWHHQLPLDSFSNLRILRVKFCEHLLNLIPRHLIQSFKNLKEIEVGWCENLRHVFDVQGYDDTDQVQDGVYFLGEVLFSNLEILQLYNLPKIKEIWHHQLPLNSFSNLRILRVGFCEHLLNLIPCCLIQSFKNLKEIEVRLCENLRHVFDVQGYDDADHVEIFSKSEETLKLENLIEQKGINIRDNEKSESSGGCFSCFSPFRCVQCSSIFYLGKEDKDKGNVNISNQDGVHFLGEVLLSNLEKLELFGLYELKEIWHHRFPQDSFSNLRILRVEWCDSLLNIIPCHLIQSFKNLKEIKVSWCWNLKHLFDLQGCDTYSEILTKLEILELEALKKLKGIIICNNEENDDTRGLFCPSMPMTFQNLKCLSINCCGEEVEEDEVLFGEKISLPILEKLIVNDVPKLKEIWDRQLPCRSNFNLQILEVYNCGSLLNLMPSHLISMFTNLKNIAVDDCEVLEHVFDMQMTDRRVPILRTLETLKLKKLPRLRYILYGEGKINDNTKCLFSPLELMDFQSLMVLSIENCAEEDEVERHVNATVKDVTLFSEKVSFPNLEELNLKNLPKLKEVWHHQVPHGYFNHLQILEVYDCPCLVNLIPSHLIQEFKNLFKVKVDNCGVLEHVFVFDPQGPNRNIGIFPKLEILELKGLRRLRCIISDEDKTNSTSCLFSPPAPEDFQNLKHLCIKGCEEDENEGQNNTVLFGEKIALPSLEELDISNLDNLEKIWHNDFIADSFGRLKILSIESCQKLQNVIPCKMMKRLSSLQILKIVACDSVEEVFDLEAINNSEESLDLQLRELCLGNLKNLKLVWNKAPQGFVTYQNLNRVQISCCPSFQTPFPGYVMRSLLQVKEDINSYGVDQEIVAHEDVVEAVTMFLFPELTSLTKSCLEKLQCFYVRLHTLKWPILKTLEVESRESLEILASELEKTDEQPIFLCDKVAFPNLEILNLSLKLKKIEDFRVLFGALSNLKILTVENCPCLQNPFAPQFIQCLNNLKKLTVKNCDLLEEVFDLKGLDPSDVSSGEILSKLEELSLSDLPELRHICKNSPQASCFQNLKSLQMKKCSSLTYLFLPSMALGLVQLQHLSIEDCPKMENIVMVQDEVFESQHRQTSCFQNLKSVLVKQCHPLKYLFRSSMVLGLLQLQNLCIEHCSGMEEIILEDGDIGNRPGEVLSFRDLKIVRVVHCDILKHLFSPCMALGLEQLEDLCIEHCPKMKEIVMKDGNTNNRPGEVLSFRKLKIVRVVHCDILKHLFSPCMALGLEQLEDLCIEHCSKMKEIVMKDGDTNNRPGEVSSFRKLKIVRVVHCDILTHLFSPCMALGLEQLEGLCIEHCSKMEEIIMGDGDKSNRAQQVSALQNLKSLRVMHCHNLMYLLRLQDLRPEDCPMKEIVTAQDNDFDNQTPQLLCFKNLEYLWVEQCHSLMYLFSFSMALGLAQLQDLCIENCSKMQENVTPEEAVTDKIIFPQLTHVSLLKLPKLRSFYLRTRTIGKNHTENSDTSPGMLFGEEVAFPTLVSLHISGMDKIKEIWSNKWTAHSLSKLEEVKVEDCDKVQKGLPFFLLKCSQRLKILRIANCGQIKEVFDLEGVGILDVEIARPLNKLELHDLPKLLYIWNEDPYGILTFHNLEFVEVLRCQDLKGQYPSCLNRDLSQLEKQLIRFHKPKDPEQEDQEKTYVFPQVVYDKRFDLPKNKGKEVVVVRASERDYESTISEDIRGTSG